MGDGGRNVANHRLGKRSLAATAALATVAASGLWWLAFGAHERPVEAPLAQQPMPSEALPDATPRPAEVPAPATNGEKRPATTLDDLYAACGGMLQGGLPPDDVALRSTPLGAPDCVAALDSMFLGKSASATMLPVSPPIRWGDLFDDVGGNISAVIAAANDPQCVVPEAEIRPELGARCAARPMAKLAVLAHACGSTFDIRGPRENRPWDQVETTEPGAYPLTIVDLDGMRYEEYDPDGERRQERLDAYARYSADQETYWTRRREEDQLRFRSAWLASKCAPHVGWLGWMRARPDAFDDLMTRAAALGDPFALAHNTVTPERARRLVATNPAQAYLHLAALESGRVRDEWEREARALRDEAEKPYFDARRRYLAFFGIECPDPCSESALRALETEHKRTVRVKRIGCSIRPGRCARAELDELEEALNPARRATAAAQEGPEAEHRRRAEAVRMKYVIAAQTVAAAAGIELHASGYADPAKPTHLDVYGVQQARVAAQAMIAEHQARFGTGGSSDASAPP